MISSTSGTLLVVDADPLQLSTFARILEGAGYECLKAQDGVEALALLRDAPIVVEAVLIDRRMPGMDGLELLGRLKADPRFSSLPVILQTSTVEGKEIREAMAAGAYFYLPKSVSEEMLLTTVLSAVESCRRFREVQTQLQEHSRSMTLMDLGRFRFRSPEEAKSLTQMVAAACPDPAKTAIGLSELLLNAVEHGNLEMGYQDTSAAIARRGRSNEIHLRLADLRFRDRFAELRFERLPDRYRLLVRDQGPGFDWREFLDLSPQRAFDTHGRGIFMAAHCFDRIEFLGKGNAVSAEILLPDPWPAP